MYTVTQLLFKLIFTSSVCVFYYLWSWESRETFITLWRKMHAHCQSFFNVTACTNHFITLDSRHYHIYVLDFNIP